MTNETQVSQDQLDALLHATPEQLRAALNIQEHPEPAPDLQQLLGGTDQETKEGDPVQGEIDAGSAGIGPDGISGTTSADPVASDSIPVAYELIHPPCGPEDSMAISAERVWEMQHRYIN